MITLYGVTEDGTSVPVQVTDDGKLIVHKDESFQPGDDIEVGGIDCNSITAASSITAAGDIQTGVDRAVDGTGASLEDYGGVRAARPSTQVTPGTASVWEGWLGEQIKSQVFADGSASFAKQVELKGTGAYFTVDRDITPGTGALYLGFTQGVEKFKVGTDGSATFSGNKCGFTPDGELYFYSRGTRYKAVVQGGNMAAEPYTRATEVREKAEKLRQPKTQDIVPED